ncbi:transposase [Aneurinibacillus aneurinilyticus]|uniref:Transposase n=1 Tax=Aneurinibacillus aneurinilyticus TaxID=1391 RepID=A0A848D1G0_ANEAE|nr:transposase [Aneurinibacillus aneurinilyticus]
MHKQGGYYISRVKHNVKIYFTKERTEEPKCAEDFIKDLAPGETMEVHHVALYSLRWQIEILCKVWKSVFRIHRIKKVKKERLDCHLYGTLISILVSSSVTFKIRSLLYQKEKREICWKLCQVDA